MATEKTKARRAFLKRRGKELNSNLPRSERWFNKLYVTYKVSSDEFNKPKHTFIPDVINETYKYIIEVDGSIHDTEEVKLKDQKKNEVFTRYGYTVIRVKAYSQVSFKDAMNTVIKLRGPHYSPAKILSKAEIKKLYGK